MRFLSIKGTIINLEKVSTIEIRSNSEGPSITFAGPGIYKAFLPGSDMSQEEFEALKETVFRVLRNYEVKGFRPGQ